MLKTLDDLKDGRIVSALIRVKHYSTNQFNQTPNHTDEVHDIMWKFGSWAYADKKRANGMNIFINENDIIKFFL